MLHWYGIRYKSSRIIMTKEEKNKLINALFYPAFFILILGTIQFAEFVFDYKLNWLGVFPREVKGLPGILTMHFIHGDFDHLFNNSVGLMVLGSILYYFYKEIASRVVLWSILMTGVWLWLAGRPSYHIGASGLIYALFAFLALSGFIRKNNQLIMLSFFAIFTYGSLVWYMFPIDQQISFEGHLFGFLAGAVLAFYYRKKGPQKVEHVWEDEDDDDNEEDAYWKDNQPPTQGRINIQYNYKPKEPED